MAAPFRRLSPDKVLTKHADDNRLFSDRRGRRHYVFGLSVPCSWVLYFGNAWWEFIQICLKRPIGLKDEDLNLVKGKRHCDLT